MDKCWTELSWQSFTKQIYCINPPEEELTVHETHTKKTDENENKQRHRCLHETKEGETYHLDYCSIQLLYISTSNVVINAYKNTQNVTWNKMFQFFGESLFNIHLSADAYQWNVHAEIHLVSFSFVWQTFYLHYRKLSQLGTGFVMLSLVIF